MPDDPRRKRATGLRDWITELTTDLLKAEEELVAVEADEQLALTDPNQAKLNHTPRTPAEESR